MTSSRKLLALLTLVGVVCLGAGLAAGRFVRSPAQVAADAEPPPPTVLTAKVTRGAVTRALVVRGSVSTGASRPVEAVAPEGTDAVITREPLRRGQPVRSGTVLTEVSYRPVIALAGRVPLIRDLTVGSTGPDVTELQDSLEALGWSIYDAEGVFGASTAAALAGFYDARGYDVPTMPAAVPEPTGEDEETGRTGRARQRPPVELPDVVVARRAELVVIRDLPGVVDTVSADVGSTPSGPVLTVATSAPVVRATVSPAERALVRRGGRAWLASASPPYSAAARILTVGQTVQDEQTGAFVVPLTLRPATALPEGVLDKGLEVRFDVARTATKGIIVPVSAVYTDSDGRTFVVRIDDGEPVTVGVTVLDTAAGRARVEPELVTALRVGDEVRIGVQR